MNETTVRELNFEDLKNISEQNYDVIRSIVLNNELMGVKDDIALPIQEKIFEEMKLVLPKIAIAMQLQLTRSMIMMAQELLRASEKVKRSHGRYISGYDIEKDIAHTRTSIETGLASQYKTEMVLWELMKKERYQEAFTMLNALDLERAGKDDILVLEAISWRMEAAARGGNEYEFFDSVKKALAFTKKMEVAYVGPVAKDMVACLLMHKLTKGIEISLNHIGEAARMGGDSNLHVQVCMQFQDLLTDKVLEAIFKTKVITDSASLNTFLSTKWDDIVASFNLINRFVGVIKRPYGIKP